MLSLAGRLDGAVLMLSSHSLPLPGQEHRAAVDRQQLELFLSTGRVFLRLTTVLLKAALPLLQPVSNAQPASAS